MHDPPCPWPPPDLSLRDISKAKAKEISGGSVLDATAARHGRDQLTYKTVKAIERGRLPETAPPSGVGHKGVLWGAWGRAMQSRSPVNLNVALGRGWGANRYLPLPPSKSLLPKPRVRAEALGAVWWGGGRETPISIRAAIEPPHCPTHGGWG